MDDISKLKLALGKYIDFNYRRVLTQLDRDPSSPTYGCFDRNYWHYKIRDFPSAVLQQGVFLLDELRKGNIESTGKEQLFRKLVLGCIEQTSRQIDSKGALSEYYPYERGYPPAAFSLYALTRILLDWQNSNIEGISKVNWKPIQKLYNHVLNREESKASNQQAIGLAGLYLGARLPNIKSDIKTIDKKLNKFLATQHEEGWFPEYGGSDLGYLSTTLDALADIVDCTQNKECIKACDRAVDFYIRLLGSDNKLPSTLNSRNTDYVLPYGLVRIAKKNPMASWLVHKLFENSDSSDHFLWSTDDRYCCHYIFSSVVRAYSLLEQMATPETPRFKERDWLPGSGILIHRPSTDITVFVGASKGGLLRIHKKGLVPQTDNGWRIVRGHHMWVSNWWSCNWDIDYSNSSIKITGPCQRVSFFQATPSKHLLLRSLAFILRQHLIPILKRLMIFRPNCANGPFYSREIHIKANELSVVENIKQFPGAKLFRGPRQNMRHVASADSFSDEEWTIREYADEIISLNESKVINTCWELDKQL
ncbi:MAG: hypothetical protein U9O87_08320 [Verrucomicrobiota bacterium]|nr:hypothetical protein [Verrucomicrobiota bacterium]